jgi:hypothetical protein
LSVVFIFTRFECSFPALALEEQARVQTDEEIVEAINQYTTALQRSMARFKRKE